MMKKAAMMAIAMLAAVAASAQTYVNAGIGKSFMNTEIGDITVEEPATAMLAGVSHNFNLGERLGLEAGINYQFDYKRKDMDIQLPKESYIIRKRSNLVAPIELNCKFDVCNALAVKLFAGPSLFYGLTHTSTTYMNGEKLPVEVEDLYDKGTYSRFMLAGSVGLAVEVPMGLRLKAAYMYDFTEMYKASDVASTKLNLLSFTLGYAF